jgi:hypothetical protein
MAGRWFKVGSVQESKLPALTISALTAEMSGLIVSGSDATVSTGTFAGQPVTIVSYRDGSRLYIAGCRPDGSVTKWRRRRESNPCTGLCRPLPKPLGHSAAGASFAGG